MESSNVSVTIGTIANRRQKFLYLSIAILLIMTITTTGILIFDKVQEQTLPIAKRLTPGGQTSVPLTSTEPKGPLTTEITTIVPTAPFTVSGLHDASMSPESPSSTSITHVSSYEQDTSEIETTSSRMAPFTPDITSSTPFQTDTVSQTESTTTPNCGPDLLKTITNDSYPVDCSGFNISVGQNAIYTIYPSGSANSAVRVNCMSTCDGIWTVIQRRFDGSVDFYRNWNDYKEGFGDASGEYWLGNYAIYQLTSQSSYKLKVVINNMDNVTSHAIYDTFKIFDESDGYRLIVGCYHGDAGDFLSYHSGSMFSTLDRDNDRHDNSHCAISYTGAWWYHSCHWSNLNGRYEYETGDVCLVRAYCIAWGYVQHVKETTMMIQNV